MIALLLAALVALQDRPAIQEVRTVTGGFARRGCWLPLKIRLSGPAGFEGRLTASADAGFRVTRPVRIPANGAIDVILPVVLLAKDARVDVILSGPAGEIDRRPLPGTLQFLDRDRLVLMDPSHPESEALKASALALPNGTPVRFAESSPDDWNEAAEWGAMEIVDAVVVADGRAIDLAMTSWRALGGSVVTQPRRDLLERLKEPAARFPSVDPAVSRFTVDDSWIPAKRDATILFLVIYGFGFFVAVFVTWSRKGGPRSLVASAVGVSALFVAAYGAFYPKGNLAVRTWVGIVDAPEAPVAIAVSALWGTGRGGDVEFGRAVKPVHSTERDAARRDLEMLLTAEGRWVVRGAAPGDPARFVSIERLAPLQPLTPYLTEEGSAQMYRAEESAYYLRVPRKKQIRLQDPATAPAWPIRAVGLVEVRSARVFRVELNR